MSQCHRQHVRSFCWALGLVVAVAWAQAEETIGPRTPVAWIEGRPVRLIDLENELLRKEGADALRHLVSLQLERIPWSRLADDDVILAMGNWQVPRILLVAELLDERGPEVRNELINLRMMRMALERYGIEITGAVLHRELERQEAAFRRRLEERDLPIVPFANYLEERQGISLDEYMAEEAFQMAAGLHALVFEHSVLAPTPEAEEALLRDHFVRHRDRFGDREAYRLAVIHRPFDERALGDERPAVPVTEERKATQRRSIAQLRQDILADNSLSFERAWSFWGRPYDPGANSGGQIGWVDRRGRPSVDGAMPVPPTIMEEVFAQAKNFDRSTGADLLEVLEHDAGLVLVKVLAHRPASFPAFEAVRDQVRRDLIISDLTHWSNQMRLRIRQETEVRFAGWNEIVAARQGAAQQYRKALEHSYRPARSQAPEGLVPPVMPAEEPDVQAED